MIINSFLWVLHSVIFSISTAVISLAIQFNICNAYALLYSVIKVASFFNVCSLFLFLMYFYCFLINMFYYYTYYACSLSVYFIMLCIWKVISYSIVLIRIYIFNNCSSMCTSIISRYIYRIHCFRKRNSSISSAVCALTIQSILSTDEVFHTAWGVPS